MNLKYLIVIGCALFLTGCPRPTKPVIVEPPKVVSPVVGTWENNVRGENRGRMIFKEGGELRFENGMEFYNPGRWEYDPMHQVLIIHLPQAPDGKLDIFKMYVGDGVQAFDRAQKQITYRFDAQTTSLNVAGWTYTKVDTTKPQIQEEPTLR